MRNLLTKSFIALALLLGVVTVSFGYNSPVGVDPKNLSHDREYKGVMKTVYGSDASGLKSAVTAGHILSYVVGEDTVHDGYTVSRIGANTPAGQRLVACIANQDIATGNTGYVSCITKGYVDFVKYDATTAIVAGNKVCVNAEGVAVVCAGYSLDSGSALNTVNGEATAESGIIALESKASGTGSDLKVMVNLQ